MCQDGHALIRMYEARAWYLQCIACPHRILEGRIDPPLATILTIPEPPEEQELAS